MKPSDPLSRLTEIRSQIIALKREAHGVIESLKADFDGAITDAESATPAPAPAPKRRGRKPAAPASAAPKPEAAARKSPMKGKKRPASPSGPLAPAVVGVLTTAGRPMSVREIYEALLAANYVFTAGDAKKNMGVRMYKLPGVTPLGNGMFGLADAKPAPAPAAEPAPTTPPPLPAASVA